MFYDANLKWQFFGASALEKTPNFRNPCGVRIENVRKKMRFVAMAIASRPEGAKTSANANESIKH